MDDIDDPAKLFASRSPDFYRSPQFQNGVDPFVRPSLRAFIKGLINGCFGFGHAAAKTSLTTTSRTMPSSSVITI